MSVIRFGEFELDEQTLVQVTRKGNDLQSTEVCQCRFVKLIGKGGWEDEK